MTQREIQIAAGMLYAAERSRNPIPPITESASPTVDEAYAIQLENIKRAVQEGQVVSGKKIGLTSPGIQQQLGVNEPDYGHLFASMDLSSTCQVPTMQLLQPKIEGEIAFVLKQDLSGGQITPEQVRSAIDYVVAAFEIVDSRIADWRIKLADTVADNASSGRYILGETRLGMNEVDLPDVTMKLMKNGQQVGEGVGANVVGDPVNAVAWLANRLWSYGVVLKAGEVVLSGAFSAAPVAEQGDIFTAEFSSFGSVSAEFV